MFYIKTCLNLIKKSLFIILITFFLSLIIDFFFGKLILRGLDSFLVKTEFYGRLMRIDHPVFHHSFKNNVYYKNHRGFEKKNIFCTDNNGFRSECGKKSGKEFDIGFMGDSFVEGTSENFEDTFVGIFSNKNKNLKIANLGITSYAPSIYYSKMKYLLNNGFKFKHIIFFIDVSDLYDDSVFYKLNEDDTISERDEKEKGLKRRKFLRTNFPITNYYMFVIKQNSRIKKNIKNNPSPTIKNTPSFNKKAAVKAEWTYFKQDNHPEYNLGILESQKLLIKTMNKTYELLKKNNIQMSVAVYPWPQQIENDLVNSKHVTMWKEFCIEKCVKFLNFFPFFFEEKNNSSFLEVYKKYYYWNDIHFNAAGNKIIAERLLEHF